MQQEYLEILLEDMRGKFELILEGHESLRSDIRETRTELKKDIELNSFKIDALNQKIDDVDARLSQKIDDVDAKLSQKIDAVATDLREHRLDTEAHRQGWSVRE